MGTAMFHVKQTGTEPPRLGISNVEAWDKTDPDPNKKDPTPSPKAVIRLSQGGKPADHTPTVSLSVSRETSNVRVQDVSLQAPHLRKQVRMDLSGILCRRWLL
jgi:hypothetical protein